MDEIVTLTDPQVAESVIVAGLVVSVVQEVPLLLT
jgi:hypothetical protein